MKLISGKSYALDKILLRQVRQECGLSQNDLATKAGYSERVIRKAELEGRAAGATIETIADTLREHGASVSVQDFIENPLMITQRFMSLFEEHHERVLDQCRELFADDFEFVCHGPEGSPVAGTFAGLVGFQSWLNGFFQLFQRKAEHQLNPQFFANNDSVVVRYHEVVTAAGLVSPPLWVNLHFEFSSSRISRISDEYDTHTGNEFLRQVLLASDRSS